MMHSRGEAPPVKAKHEPRSSRAKAMNTPKAAKGASLVKAREGATPEDEMPLLPQRLATV